MVDTSQPGQPGDPRFSIIIPSYQQGEYLEEAIRSVLLQAYDDVECIVVDGGSNDTTPHILAAYRDLLTWSVSEPDRGQAHAVNKGFAVAQGRLLTFMGSDDMLMPGALRDAAERWKADPTCGAVTGAFVYMDSASCIMSSPRLPYVEGGTPADFSTGTSYRLHQVATFYSAACLDEVGRTVQEELRYTMDRELLMRVARVRGITLSEAVYAAFRMHGANKSDADTLPFYREFAALPLRFLDGNTAADRSRRRTARRILAHGYRKYALQSPSLWRGVLSMLRMMTIAPGYACRVSSLRSWIYVLRLRRRSPETFA
ncbi:MAG: glycosyltransferase [Ignavibacteriae bacterium]|nr:glycosyltransferase [Ignavibacteriota bacterium]